MATRYWIGGSGTWDNSTTTNWSTTSGGSGGASAPTTSDNVIFDANSGTSATVTVTATATSSYASINKSDLTLSLSGSPTLTTLSYLTLTSGTITLNNNTLTIYLFFSPDGATRTINFGTGSITCTAGGSTLIDPGTGASFTTTGTPTFNANYSGSTGTRTFSAPTGFRYSLNVTAGSDIVSITNSGAGNFFNSVDFTGFTGSLATSTNPLSISGNLTLSSGMTVSGYTGTVTMSSTYPTINSVITTNGVTIGFPLVFTGGGFAGIGSALVSTSSLTLTACYFQIGSSYNITVSSMALNGGGAVFYTNGGQLITLTGSGTCWNVTAGSISSSVPGTSTITCTSNSAKTFVGANRTYTDLNLDQGGTGALTISGNNTFYSISNSVRPATITVTAGSTQTVGSLNLNGTSGNLVTLGSSASSAFTIARITAGINTCTYCSVSYMTGNTSSGTVLWRFLNSTNGGNNTNLTFASKYYWVGGSGTWNNSSTTNWSLTSGGAGAQGPPTANDDVVFDANSNATAYTVTTGTSPACFNFTTAGPASGSMTLTATTAFNVYGSATVPSSGVAITTGSNVVFRSTYVGQTIGIAYTGGFTAGSVEFNGVGGAWTLTNNLSGSLFTLTNGTLTTNNYNISGLQFQSNNSNTRSLNLGSSTIAMSFLWDMTTSTGMTLNAGTSTIKVNDSGFGFYGGGLSYYNLLIGDGCNTTITGSNSFNNITGGGTYAATYTFTAGTTQTVANLNLNGTSGNLITLGSTTTSAFTITRSTAGINTCAYCSVSYMTGTTTAVGGGAVLWRFFNSTNGGNNTNLTFANIYYWVGGSGTWDATTTTNWSLTSGGSGGAGVPTSADDVIFNSASNATTYTVSGSGSAYCFNLTLGAPASGSVAINPTFLYVYGNTTVTSSSNVTFGGQLYYLSSYPVTLTTNGLFIGIFNFLNTATITLGSALTVGQTSGGGSLDTSTSNYSLTVTLLFDQGAFGSGTLSLNASTVTITGYNSTSTYSLRIGSSQTVNAGTSTINLVGSANGNNYLISLGNHTYYNVNFNTGNYSNATYNITDTGTNTFNTLTYNASSAAPSLNSLVLSGNIQYGNLYLNYAGAATYNNRLFVRSDTIGTQRTFTSTSYALTAAYTDYRDITTTGTQPDIGTFNNGNCGGNSGITFPAAKTVYWNLAGSQNWSATGWAASSGGTPAAANFPLAQDTVGFDDTGSAGTVTIDNNWNIGSLNMSNRTSAMTLATGATTPTIYGSSWYYGTGVTTTGTGAITFSCRNALTFIYGNGVTMTQPIIIDSIGGGISLVYSNLITTNTITLTRGTLNLNGDLTGGRTLTCGLFNSDNSNTRAIAFGTGSIIIDSGVAGTVFTMTNATNFTYTGTPAVTITAGGGGSRYVNFGNGGGATESNALSFAFTGGSAYFSGSTYFSIAGYCKNLDLSGVTAGGNFPSNNDSVTVYGNFTLSSATTVNASTGTMTFAATTYGKNINSNGVTINFPIVINGSGGTIITVGALTSTSTLSIINGNLNTSGGNCTFTTFTISGGVLVLNSNMTLTDSGTAVSVTGGGFGSNGSGYLFLLTSASPKTFAGGNKDFSVIGLSQSGTGTLTISGNNTLAKITNSVQPSTITFTAGTTQTVTSFNVSGTAGNLVTLNSTTPGTRFTISQSSGKNILSYLSIQDSAVTGGAKFFAGATSTNVSNNLGWIFANPANPLSINSAGVLSTPNIFDETQVLTNSGKTVAERTTSTSYQISGILDETKTLTYNSLPVAKRIDKNGNLYVSGYLDEFNPQ